MNIFQLIHDEDLVLRRQMAVMGGCVAGAVAKSVDVETRDAISWAWDDLATTLGALRGDDVDDMRLALPRDGYPKDGAEYQIAHYAENALSAMERLRYYSIDSANADSSAAYSDLHMVVRNVLGMHFALRQVVRDQDVPLLKRSQTLGEKILQAFQSCEGGSRAAEAAEHVRRIQRTAQSAITDNGDNIDVAERLSIIEHFAGLALKALEGAAS